MMGPMKTATTTICEEDVPTVSVVLPILNQLRRNFRPNDDDSKSVADLKQAITNNLSLRYSPDVQDTDFLLKAAALDPRFKLLPFLDDTEKHRIFGILEKEASLENISVRNVEVKQEPDDTRTLPTLPSLPEETMLTDQASTSATASTVKLETYFHLLRRKRSDHWQICLMMMFILSVKLLLSLSLKVPLKRL